MALSITNRGSGNHNTGASSFTLSPGSNCTAGATLVLCVAADNSSSGGATNDFTTVTDGLGNTWTKRQSPVFDNGAASAGVQGAIYTTSQNAGAVQTSTVITVNFGSSPVAKTWTMTEVTPGAGKVAEFRTGGNKSAGATATAMTLGASATVNIGEVIVACFYMESGTTQSVSTPDGDTTNGSWTTNQYNEIGSTTSGSCIVSQAKLQTTANSAQTYDVTVGVSSDYHGSYVILKEITVHTTSLAADGGSTADIAASTRTLAASVAADGGGSAVISNPTRTTLTSVASDGGSGIAVDATVESGSAEHFTSLAADGAGSIAIAGSTRTTFTSCAADGAGSTAIAGSMRTTFTASASDGAGSNATVATRTTGTAITSSGTSDATIAGATRTTFTAVAATGASGIAVDATVTQPGQEHFTSIAADGASEAAVSAARVLFSTIQINATTAAAVVAYTEKPPSNRRHRNPGRVSSVWNVGASQSRGWRVRRTGIRRG